jgi:hypothetical protein
VAGDAYLSRWHQGSDQGRVGRRAVIHGNEGNGDASRPRGEMLKSSIVLAVLSGRYNRNHLRLNPQFPSRSAPDVETCSLATHSPLCWRY